MKNEIRNSLILFGQLNDGDVDWLIRVGQRVQVDAHTTIIEEGRPLDGVYIVLDCELVVWRDDPVTGQVGQVGPGEVVGEMSFIDARPPSASVTTKRNGSLFLVKRVTLEQQLERNFGFAARFYRASAMILSERIRAVMGQADADGGELDDNILDGVGSAGQRLDRLVRHFY